MDKTESADKPTPPPRQDHKYEDTSVLSISSKYIYNDCMEVAHLLHKAGIAASVAPNYTVSPKGKDFQLETGCNITLTALPPEEIKDRVWQPLQDRFQLGCAHLHVVGKFRGCIYDFMRPSNCPHQQS